MQLTNLVWSTDTMCMTVVNVQEAKTSLSSLIARAEAGEDIVIARAGKPVLRLVPLEAPEPRRFGGMDFVVPDDFDAPLPEDELDAWS